MKQKKHRFNPYGLRARLCITLALSAIVCIVLFFILNYILEIVFTEYYERSDFERVHTQKQIENLQEFVTENNISTKNINQLKLWEKKQPIIYMDLYDDGKCIYSSIYDEPFSNLVTDSNIEEVNRVTIKLADCEISAFIYSDFTYQFYVIRIGVSIIASLIIFLLLFVYNNSKMISYICRLNEEVQILEGGNLEYHVSEEGNDEITDLARSMNNMRMSLQQQMETEQQLHQANRQLITEMSHDLRTPLTGIMLYIEVLRSHRYDTDEQLQDYLEKIDSKAHHLKVLSDHLFEYAMNDYTSKRNESQTMELAFGKAINSMIDDLKARSFSIESDLSWSSCYVQTNPLYVSRIFENIISNIGKYAEPATIVFVNTLVTDKYCGFTIMNTLSVEKTSVESNGVGIESIRSMMKQMNGMCSVEQTDSAFEITLLFPKE